MIAPPHTPTCEQNGGTGRRLETTELIFQIIISLIYFAPVAISATKSKTSMKRSDAKTNINFKNEIG